MTVGLEQERVRVTVGGLHGSFASNRHCTALGPEAIFALHQRDTVAARAKRHRGLPERGRQQLARTLVFQVRLESPIKTADFRPKASVAVRTLKRFLIKAAGVPSAYGPDHPTILSAADKHRTPGRTRLMG